VVLGWADSPLARAADVALPITTHAETGGTFVNVERRLQRFDRAFPAPGVCARGSKSWATSSLASTPRGATR
jgi:predicted molibdopterin-dependent oxidoreductase YjgC